MRPTPFLPTTLDGGNAAQAGFTSAGAGGMDVARSAKVAQGRRRRRWLVAGGVALAAVAVTVGLARLKPAVPNVDRANVWIDTVRRGPMIRQVRGLGTLVPEEITLDRRPHRRAGRTHRHLQPGATVDAGHGDPRCSGSPERPAVRPSTATPPSSPPRPSS